MSGGAKRGGSGREAAGAADRALVSALVARARRVAAGELRMWAWRIGRRWRYGAGLPRHLAALAAGRYRTATRPRIGVLGQHAPRQATVPWWYERPRRHGRLPSIQLVTPSLDQGPFVERTVSSVLRQGYPHLAYHVQDGGSTDGTLDVLRRGESAHWTWRSEPDPGQGAAINRAFAQGDSELMGWLNSDDLLLPGALAAAGSLFAAHPEVDVVYGHRMMIDEHDRRVGIWVTPRHDLGVLRLADYVPQETLLWRRSLWDRVGGLDEALHYALDWDLLLRFADAGARFHRMSRFLGAFRVHEAQKTTSAWDELGRLEVAAIRARANGRPISDEEVARRLRPVLSRQLLLGHVPRRLAGWIPGPRIELRSWLGPGGAGPAGAP